MGAASRVDPMRGAAGAAIRRVGVNWLGFCVVWHAVRHRRGRRWVDRSLFATRIHFWAVSHYFNVMPFVIAASLEFKASEQLADYLIVESRERGDLLTPLKLQKLMFYADAWSLALYDKEITPEKFQAWVHGPVALSQYHRFKENRWRPILDEIDKPSLSSDLEKHLCEIVDVFGVETGPALEAMTHQELPWIEARGGIPDDQPCNAYIDKDVTKKFYASLANQD